MKPSTTILLMSTAAVALTLGTCGFSPNQGPTGSGASGGSTGNQGRGGFVLAGSTGTGTGGSITGTAGGMECGSYDRPSQKLPPNILIVLDASGSMNEDSNNEDCNTPNPDGGMGGGMTGCGPNSKWALLTPALNQVVMATQTAVNWGLKLFADMGNQCGVSPNTVAVPVGANTAAMIQTVIAGRTDPLGNVSNGSYTPTRRAMDAAVTYFGTVTEPNPKYIVLATDGQPNCTGTNNNTNNDTTGAVQSVTRARMANIPTFVVGISAPAGSANDAMNMMAVEGGMPRQGDPRYYPVTNADEFVAVLNTLVSIAASCVFPVPAPPTNDGTTNRSNISVKADGVDIPMDATNGWTFTDGTMTSVTVHGTACDMIEAGNIQNVTIVFRCVVP
jgi:hypothetical protein